MSFVIVQNWKEFKQCELNKKTRNIENDDDENVGPETMASHLDVIPSVTFSVSVLKTRLFFATQ